MNVPLFLWPLVLVTAGIVIAMLEPMVSLQNKSNFWVPLAVVVLAFWRTWQAPIGLHPVFAGAFLFGGWQKVASLLLLGAAGLLFVLFASLRSYLMKVEAAPLFLFTLLGMLVLVAANNLLALFLGFELLSLPLYVLVALRGTPKANEAGLKFVLLGALSSAFLLLGMAFLYLTSRSLQYVGLTKIFLHSGTPLQYVGLALLSIGLLFKWGVFPFHQWIPDVYEGADATVTVWMAVLTKIAMTIAVIRVLIIGFWPIVAWFHVLALLALFSIWFGNLMAWQQKDFKRFMAYSSIANAGFLLFGVSLRTLAGDQAALFYLLPYLLAVIGLFGLGLGVAKASGEILLEDLLSTWASRPWGLVVLSILFLSLAGIPLTGGFFAKLYLLQAGLSASQWGLTIGVLLGAFVGFISYLTLLLRAWSEQVQTTHLSKPLLGLAGLLAAVVVYLGVDPGLAFQYLTGFVAK